MSSNFSNLFRSSSMVITWCDYLLSAHHIYIDKGAQAVVLAEIAACIFIASCAITNIGDCFYTDEGGLFSIGPESQSLLCCTDRSGLTAVFVDNDLRLFAVGTEA